MPLESVTKVAEADFPTRWGPFRILGFEGKRRPEDVTGASQRKVEELVVLVMGDIQSEPPLVRIHSQCLTGDVLGSLRCDCRLQLEMALKKISQAGTGILLYERQEGRGIGLMAKLKAYELQDQGLDTVEANEELGFAPDYRFYELPATVLRQLGVSRVRLMTTPTRSQRLNPPESKSLSASRLKSSLRKPSRNICAPSRKNSATSRTEI
jgi:GTP cyclohydrolase II